MLFTTFSVTAFAIALVIFVNLTNAAANVNFMSSLTTQNIHRHPFIATSAEGPQ